MCSPCTVPYITADYPVLFGRSPRSTGVAGIGLGAEHSQPQREVMNARGALQSVRFRCSVLGVATSGSSSSDWLLVQSFLPVEVLPVLLRHSHFAVGHFLGGVVFPQRGPLVTV